MSDEEELPTPSQVKEIEDGIFNMAITLTQHVTAMKGDPNYARQYVAFYLQRLADGLREMNKEQEA